MLVFVCRAHRSAGLLFKCSDGHSQQEPRPEPESIGTIFYIYTLHTKFEEYIHFTQKYELFLLSTSDYKCYIFLERGRRPESEYVSVCVRLSVCPSVRLSVRLLMQIVWERFISRTARPFNISR